MKYQDSEILDSIKSGQDDRILNHLYAKIYPLVRNHISRNGGDYDEAQDIFQEAVLVFYNKVIQGTFDPAYKIEAFVFSVAKKMWINRFHRRNRSTELQEFHEVPVSDGKTYDFVFSDEREKIIKTLFSELGETCQKILEAVVYHRMSMKEIKELLNFSTENTAKTKHYKCKQRLIKRLKDNEGFKDLLRS